MKYTNMVLYKKTSNSSYKQEFYLGEEAARKDANRMFVEGFVLIELYSRCRDGWTLVKKVKQNEREAEAKRTAHVNQLLKETGATIIYN